MLVRTGERGLKREEEEKKGLKREGGGKNVEQYEDILGWKDRAKNKKKPHRNMCRILKVN